MRSLREALEILACRYDQYSVLNLKRKVGVHLPINGVHEAKTQTRKTRKGWEECCRVINSLRVSKYAIPYRNLREMTRHRSSKHLREIHYCREPQYLRQMPLLQGLHHLRQVSRKMSQSPRRPQTKTFVDVNISKPRLKPPDPNAYEEAPILSARPVQEIQ